jgi:hypothetical protein
MADDPGSNGAPDDAPTPPVWHKAGEALGDDDRRLLELWRESLILQDPRYKSKVVLKFAALAMDDDAFRQRLVHDTDGVLREFRSKVDWPVGLKLRFYENTEDTLNVVLPPRAGGMSEQPAALRDALRSRTDTVEGFLNDNFDIGDTDQTDMFGDEDEGDHPSFPPHTLEM